MDKRELTNKNSTFEEFRNAVKELLFNEYEFTEEEIDIGMKEYDEILTKQYKLGYVSGSEAWQLSQVI